MVKQGNNCGHDAVGYRRPPIKRRFKESGNPKGRPKGAKSRKTIVRGVANEMHILLEYGERRTRSTLEIVLLRLRNAALYGKDIRAIDELHRLIKKYEPQELNDNACVAVFPAEMSPDEWIAEQEERNKTRKPPAGYRD